MVLRCSLLGHSYGESTADREREERGSEVVLTVTEYEECTRCGKQHVLSENTEVKSLESDDAEPTAETTQSAFDPDSNADDPTDASPDPIDQSPGLEEQSPEQSKPESDPDASPIAEAEGESEPGDDTQIPTDESGDPIVDDGEILENDPEASDTETDRSHGEWPDSEDVGPPREPSEEPSHWPDDAGRDEASTDRVGPDDDPESVDSELTTESPSSESDDDAVILEDGTDSTASDPDGNGTTLEYDNDAGDPPSESTAEPASDAPPAESDRNEPVAETGITSDASAPAPGESSVPDGVTTEFYCPQCEFVASGDRGSLRTGDICPDCRKGYLGERTMS